MAHHFHSGFIAAPTSPVEFPHPSDLWGRTPAEASKRYARAQWYLPISFKEEGLIAEYLQAGELPDGTPPAALQTEDWARRVAVPDNALMRRNTGGPRPRKVPLIDARAAYVRLCWTRVARTPCREIVPSELGFDPMFFRTWGEAQYAPALAAL